MEDQVRARLQALRAEFETGQKRLSELDTQRAQLTETMLRISGAIQVLEELAGERAEPDAPAANGAGGGAEADADAGADVGVANPAIGAAQA